MGCSLPDFASCTTVAWLILQRSLRTIDASSRRPFLELVDATVVVLLRYPSVFAGALSLLEISYGFVENIFLGC